MIERKKSPNPQLRIGLRDLFEIRDTGKYGLGVFTLQHFRKGEAIHALNGTRITLGQSVRQILSGKEAPNDPLQIGRRTYLDLDNLSRCFNHCCHPNAGVRSRSNLFALRDIAENEEITYDYSTTVAPTDWSMKCRCSSSSCRKVIGDIRSMPKAKLLAYKRAGAFQRYMRPLLELIERGKYEMPRYELLALERLGNLKQGEL